MGKLEEGGSTSFFPQIGSFRTACQTMREGLFPYVALSRTQVIYLCSSAFIRGSVRTTTPSLRNSWDQNVACDGSPIIPERGHVSHHLRRPSSLNWRVCLFRRGTGFSPQVKDQGEVAPDPVSQYFPGYG